MSLSVKHIVGGFTWMCPRCEYEDDIAVRLHDLDYECEDVLRYYLALPKRLRAQILRLLETLNQAVQESQTSAS